MSRVPRLALGISIVWLPLAFLTDGITVLLLPVRLSGSERAASAIGLISFAGLAAAVVAQPLAGLVSDRLRPRLDRRWFLAVTAPLAAPVGFKVVRVDLERREIIDFAINRIAGPASKLPHDGFERPSHCAFGPDDALYVTDFGEIEIAPEAAGIRIQAGTGSVWRISRVEGQAAADRPPAPTTVPFYLGQYAVWGIGLLAAVGAIALLLRRAGRRRT